jgi:flagellar hook-basal body complex protein FliE
MVITPIQKIDTLNELNKIGNSNIINETPSIGELPFKNIFTQALNDYKEAEMQVNKDIYGLATGQSDDLHNLSINMKKAEMSFELFVQLRNKALEVYKELMNTGI